MGNKCSVKQDDLRANACANAFASTSGSQVAIKDEELGAAMGSRAQAPQAKASSLWPPPPPAPEKAAMELLNIFDVNGLEAIVTTLLTMCPPLRINIQTKFALDAQQVGPRTPAEPVALEKVAEEAPVREEVILVPALENNGVNGVSRDSNRVPTFDDVAQVGTYDPDVPGQGITKDLSYSKQGTGMSSFGSGLELEVNKISRNGNSCASDRSLMGDDPAGSLERIDDFLNLSVPWSAFVCILTIWALFIDDLRVLSMPKSTDTAVLIVNLIILGVFMGEFILCWLVQKSYRFSLAAFMDFLAAASLVPIEEALSTIGSVGDSISVARVARAARALRILRSVRAATMALKIDSRMRKMRRAMGNKAGNNPSVLADTLLNSTNTKMLLGILALLIATAVLDYRESDRAAQGGLDALDQAYLMMHQSVSEWNSMVSEFRLSIEGDRDNDTLRRLMYVQIHGQTEFMQKTSDLRKSDIEMYFAGTDAKRARSYAIISIEDMNKRQAVNSILVTIFSVFVIIVWAMSFRKDHQRLVIKPVHRMTETLKDMASDPRTAVEKSRSDNNKKGGTTEMEIIESCIARFGGLLKVGFGEAGMGIISRNLAEKEFDPVVPGQIVQAVFGFCDIRNFTDCCEVLKTDTMIFTNGIAHIVHSLVDESGGAVNKNIGDAFLSVWKLKEMPDASKKSKDRRYSHYLTGNENICDEPLKAFLNMNQQMKENTAIQELARDPRLQNKLPGYTVRLGSGLHLGWAIEGAVGSSHKVDATYLSPHVNMASRLEAATKQYGVNILISESLFRAFTPGLKEECRAVDRVTVKGSAEPLTLYIHMPSESPELSEQQRASFMTVWVEAFDLYLSGRDWGRAATLFRQCSEMFPRDYPTKVLLEVIEEEYGGKAPSGWPGYRALTSK